MERRRDQRGAPGAEAQGRGRPDRAEGRAAGREALGLTAEVWHAVAFADGDGGGNPCPVVVGAGDWSDDAMQAAAAAFGHETCFVLGGDEDVRLRYFVPQHEMEMCVHATVAATVLRGLGGPVRTPLGTREVVLDGSCAMVQQSAPEVGDPVGHDDVREVLAALGAVEGELDAGPVVSVSTARAKLLVPLEDEDALDGLRIDPERLWAVCDRLGVTGAYPYTLRARDADAAARQFPVRAGYDEDPATGVAACALGAHLAAADGREGWRRFEIAQGRAMGRPSRIVAEARVQGGAVTATRVGGRADIVRGPEPLEG